MRYWAALLFVLAGCGRHDYADKLAAMPANEIDIGTVALNLAKEFRPDLDVKAYSKMITGLAREVHELAGDTEDPVKRLSAVNTVLFTNERFSYDDTNVGDGREQPFDELLDTGKGECLSLAILYVAVAERVGYPVYGVFVPGHTIARYLGEDYYINVDPSLFGTVEADKFYKTNYSINKEAEAAGFYLQSLRNKDFASYLISSAANRHLAAGRYKQAFKYANVSVNMNPQCGECWQNLAGISWHGSIMVNDAEKSNRLFDLCLAANEKAESLHPIYLTETRVWKESYEAK